MSLHINRQAPDFSLSSTSSKIFTLSKDLKDKACILFFYSKDFNSTCTQEACAFKETFALLKQLDIAVVGISKDELATHLAFKNEFDLPFELLSDETGDVTALYEAFFPFIGLKKRITYLLDRDHKILAVYENLFDSTKHVQYMLAKLKENQLFQHQL
jgi:peroxiredoxin Q/BCP